MRSRCENTKATGYKDYGGRGIKLLWNDFDPFYKDMYVSYLKHITKHGPKQTTIDRINVNGNYSLANCRWATHKIQSLNQRKHL